MKFLQNIFMVLLAVTVMLSIRFVGILLINALLILPAASARNMSGNLREYYFFSVLFSLFSGVVGLLLSFYCDIAAGSAIVIVAAAIFFGTFWYSRKYLQ